MCMLTLAAVKLKAVLVLSENDLHATPSIGTAVHPLQRDLDPTSISRSLFADSLGSRTGLDLDNCGTLTPLTKTEQYGETSSCLF